MLGGMDSVRWLNTEEQQMWRAFLDTTRLLNRTLDRQLMADSGISLTDYEILVRLSEGPGRQLRMSDLADAMTTTRGGVTRAVTRLADAGWVCRAECSEDRRGTLAALTDAGLEKLTSASPGHVEAVRRYMFDLLSPRDVASLTHTYGEMREQLLQDGQAD